ncbi:MAG: CvpA family protein [Chloroflexota bacterium]
MSNVTSLAHLPLTISWSMTLIVAAAIGFWFGLVRLTSLLLAIPVAIVAGGALSAPLATWLAAEPGVHSLASWRLVTFLAPASAAGMLTILVGATLSRVLRMVLLGFADRLAGAGGAILLIGGGSAIWPWLTQQLPAITAMAGLVAALHGLTVGNLSSLPTLPSGLPSSLPGTLPGVGR